MSQSQNHFTGRSSASMHSRYSGILPITQDAKERKGKPNQQVMIFKDSSSASFASFAVREFNGSKA
ncbi:hypothetical protein D8Y20_09060 [Mariprofundus sp. EBB-1]|uniref:hypothetical protein n=1 Tax=Mariprofundus sp. EBB-1 TaxID=2650971 RepID=UPI000EF1BCEE|nr:hypothetical protein [Mariprofundus sp. EBB-1]RLL51532.1 hypothetical protein D8Y20_09060 [Mariprofundus sp. EBB-1]